MTRPTLATERTACNDNRPEEDSREDGDCPATQS
jgi:hypothetical protein